MVAGRALPTIRQERPRRLTRRAGDPNAPTHGLPSDELAKIGAAVGIAAVKYADLSMNRESNYKFSYGRMLSLNGNTAPYMLYAYARICGIVRKATGQSEENKIIWPEAASTILITHDSEKQLVRNLVKLPDILSEVEMELYPNRLCDYLFETSQKFNQVRSLHAELHRCISLLTHES